jgi:hypothetical protein
LQDGESYDALEMFCEEVEVEGWSAERDREKVLK